MSRNYKELTSPAAQLAKLVIEPLASSLFPAEIIWASPSGAKSVVGKVLTTNRALITTHLEEVEVPV